jgi:hypothetical protein
VDDERRCAVRAGLEGEREEQKPGQPPVLRDERDQRRDAGDDRQHDAAGHDRADEEASVKSFERWRARKPTRLSSSPATPWMWSRTVVTRSPRAIERPAITANAIRIPQTYVQTG